MQSKYKSLGSRALLVLCLLLALATGWLGDGALRLIAWLGAVALALLLLRPSPLSRWIPLIVGAISVAMLATGQSTALIWLWVIPLCLQGLGGRLGLIVNGLGYIAAVGFAAWQLSLPAASVAGVSLAVIWLLCLEQRLALSPAPISNEARWLLPPATLDADIQHELRRTERESLHGEVVVFGCAHSTTADMEQLCRLLRDQLALYERAYRLNDYGIAVLLVATSADAAEQRRNQLQHAVAPHRMVSWTPVQEIGDRFARYRSKATSETHEAMPWQ